MFTDLLWMQPNFLHCMVLIANETATGGKEEFYPSILISVCKYQKLFRWGWEPVIFGAMPYFSAGYIQ